MLEIRRKLVHFLFGNAVFALVWLLPSPIYILLVSLLLLAALVVSFFYRARRPELLKTMLSLFDREEDLNRSPANGAIQFFAGALIAVLLFSRTNAALGILALAWGDSFSTIVGIYVGRYHYRLGPAIKTLEGSAACFFASLVPLLFFISPWKALLAALVAATIEAVALVNDNLLIPVGVAAILTILG